MKQTRQKSERRATVSAALFATALSCIVALVPGRAASQQITAEQLEQLQKLQQQMQQQQEFLQNPDFSQITGLPNPAGGGAQPLPAPEEVANRLWTRFQEVCGEAIGNPQGYLDSLPPPGPSGLPVSAASPDGLVVSVQLRRGDVIEDVEFIGMPGELLVVCVVHDLDITRMMSLGMASMDQSAIPAYSAALAQAVKETVTATQGALIVGGKVQLAPPDIIEGEGLYSSFQGQTLWPTIHHRFGIQAPIAGQTRFSYAEVMAGATWIGTFFQQGNTQ